MLYSSSVREVPISQTLKHAKAFARNLGITRVTNVTRLDRVGVPVFCSIRPGAQQGSLCVNAGKGLTEDEARIGAYMEAIEFAMAEFGSSTIRPRLATPRDLPGVSEQCDALLDFCPLQGKIISLNGPLQCVEAEEITSGTHCLVPAELIYLPYPSSLPGIRAFGCSSNGLASGNTVLEATVHAVAELIERDICSFEIFRNTSALLFESSYPEAIAAISSAIREAALLLFVRYLSNEFGLPCFKAVVCDLVDETPIYVSAGYGCHANRNIALTRAVCEALQSRLSFIHGGRDDLTKRYAEFQGKSQSEIQRYTANLIERASDKSRVISFDETPSPGEDAVSVQIVFRILIEALNRAGMERIYRVVFTKPEDALQVVRIIIPKIEHYDPALRRVGHRLSSYVGKQ